MESLFDVVVKFFRDTGWVFSQVEGKTVLVMGVKGKNGEWKAIAETQEEEGRFIFCSFLPTPIPENKRLPVALFITRVNHRLAIGNFQLNFDDGSVRYQTGINVKGERLTPTLVGNLLAPNLTTMDKYLPGIMAIVYAGAQPIQALAAIDKETPK
jgi:hypothetical protein